MAGPRPQTHARRALRLLERRPVVRTREFEAQGIPRMVLSRLVERGRAERVGRGLYALAGREPPAHADLIVVARRVPKAAVCLLSALSFHGIGTRVPAEVWILIAGKAWRPRLEHPPLQVVRCSAALLAVGVDVHRIEGVPVRLTSPARTVADCFKYRSRVGLDVALEALRKGWRARRFDVEELLERARACGVERVLRPYLEAIT